MTHMVTHRNFKVLLVNLPWMKGGRWGVRAGSRWPHLKDKSEGDYLPFPFFLAYAASLLRKNDIEAHVIDAIADQIPPDKFIQDLSSLDFDILVAETSIPSFYNDMELLQKISSLDIPIVLCGPHPEIYNPEFLKRNEFIDFVLFGEYEFTLLDLTRALSEGLKDLPHIYGLIWRDGGNTTLKNARRPPFDINLLPWPYTDSLPMHKYFDLPGGIPYPSVQMVASRGCPFSCNFCLWPQILFRSKFYRTREVNDIANEMQYLIRKKGFKSIYFDDDTFNIDRKRMMRLCTEIVKLDLHNIPWAIMARVDLMDEEILETAKKSGLYAVKYGIESASQELVERCGKCLDLKKAERIIKYTKSLGIKVHLTFSFGLPGETKETIKKTIDYVLKLDPNSVQFSILTPFPGTILFDELDREGKILTKNWSLYDGHNSCVFQPDNLSPADLIEAKQFAYESWENHQWRIRIPHRLLKKIFVHWRYNGFSGVLKKAKNSFKSIYSQRKAIEKIMIILSLSEESLKITLAKIRHYINFKNLKNRYLDILGIFDGEYGYRGPFHVQIDLTNDCNNSCIACWCNSPLLKERRITQAEKDQHLPLELVKEFLDEIKWMGAREVYFSGGGEPFIYPHIFKALEHCKKNGLICFVNTNFTLLDEYKINALIELGVDHLTVSIWAGTPETYSKVHPGKTKEDFDRVKNNLIYLNRKKQEKFGKPKVNIYNVLFNMNYFEVDQMIKFAESTLSESVEFTLADTIPEKTDVLKLNSEQIQELIDTWKRIRQTVDGANRLPSGLTLFQLDEFIRRISVSKDVEEAKYDRNIIDSFPCYSGWLFARIIPNGEVHSCLKAHRIPTGSLYLNRFSEIWNSKKQLYFRKKTLVNKKSDPFFKLIGNDPDTKEAGCYKSCDDIGRNTYMHLKIASMSKPEKFLIQKIAQVLRMARGLKSKKGRKKIHKDSRTAGILHGRKAFSGPEQVEIELSNCKKAEELPENVLYRVIDDLASLGTEKVCFSSEGKMFMERDIGPIIEYAKKKHICVTTEKKPDQYNSTGFDRSEIEKIPCYIGWQYSRILADGSVVPCLKGIKKILGNVHVNSFKYIWHSVDYNEFRAKAKFLSKRDAFFRDIDCFNGCSNFRDNWLMHKQVSEE